MSNESDKVVLSKDISADIIRLQGEELLRVKRELENAEDLNRTAFNLVRDTEHRMVELQDAFSQRRLRVTVLQETMTEIQHENDGFSASLNDMQIGLLSLLSHEQNLSSEQPDNAEQQNLVDFVTRNLAESKSTAEEERLRRELEISRSEAIVLERELSVSQENHYALENKVSQLSDELTSLRTELESTLTLLKQMANRRGAGNDQRTDSIYEFRNAEEERPEPGLPGVELSRHSDQSSLPGTDKHLVSAFDAVQAAILSSIEQTSSFNDDSSSVSIATVTVVDGLTTNNDDRPQHANPFRSGPSIQHFVLAKTLCRPITVNNSKLSRSQIEDICLKAVGYSPKFLYDPPHQSKVIVDLHDRDKAILVVVSKNESNPTSILKNLRSTTRWKEVYVSLKNNEVCILGEYEYRGAPAIKLGLSEYQRLPEAAKSFVLDSGKNYRHNTEAQLMESIVKPDGIVIHGISMEAIRSRKDLEQAVVKEAKRRGYEVTMSG